MMSDPDFVFDRESLDYALHKMASRTALPAEGGAGLPHSLPESGIGGRATLDLLAPLVLDRAARLDGPTALAHMDPPTPWITWATTLWNASLNQNLLHPATAPVARELEELVVAWLAPYFGMGGGHMVPGSTIANLTGLWAAREIAGVEDVIFGETAHLSIPKAAHLLGLRARPLPCDRLGRVRPDSLPTKLDRSVMVLTAGATSTGAVDDLSLIGQAAWTHVDAAWAGPLRLSRTHSDRLAGIEHADSIAISAHKWLFQPKESALTLFRDVARAHEAISFGGAYLAAPNIGVLGSHGATAVPLLATLIAWGREGLTTRIDRCMSIADELAKLIESDRQLDLLAAPQTGVVVWRPSDSSRVDDLYSAMPTGSTSVTMVAGERWLRNVAANPNADKEAFAAALDASLRSLAF